jgi:aminopeptidase-like protein
VSQADLGAELMALIRELYPICRSLTGDGVSETLRILGRIVPIQVSEVPSGTRVFDWTVPREWNLRDAWIATPGGERVVDFRRSNLHVVSYSVPVRRSIPLDELRDHLHTLPDHPDWIPYRTSYYTPGWGFCLTQKQYDALDQAEYEVCIDSTLEDGALSYGECLLPGSEPDEVLISAHLCHPSLCNDNLSGLAVSALLARALRNRPRRYSYRFLYLPGTIGSIAWLARNPEAVARVRHGLTLVCLGDASPLTYKRSLGGGAEIDRAAARVLAHAGPGARCTDFTPFGYDERQFNSPGFRLPVGSLMRARHGEFPEYHTSADDLDFVSGEQLARSHAAALAIVEVLEGNRTYRNRCPHGEPQLGRRGIYRALGGEARLAELEYALLWVLACSDGSQSLLAVAERAGLRFAVIRRAADLLLAHELLEEVPGTTPG